MKTNAISALMLERYRLGELHPEDKAVVEKALAADSELRSCLEKLDESDRELRLRYPPEELPLFPFLPPRFVQPTKLLIRAAVAAAITLAIVLPVFRILIVRNTAHNGIAIAAAPHEVHTERAKGNAATDSELSIYLQGTQGLPLPNQAVLEAGHTVQLAYTAPAGAQHYGVIFSIDGRSVVTMHYPYRRGQSSLLVSGRRTFLNEAYTLDDAPGYEVFVLVVSEKPLDPETVLHKARRLSEQGQETPFTAQSIIEHSGTTFEDCEVETITVLKK